jgi:PRTRC genetic system protein C
METHMSSLKTEALLREFYYNGVRIPDPGPDLTVDQVRDLLVPRFPEIATALVHGPEDMGNVLRYKFTRAIGEKG